MSKFSRWAKCLLVLLLLCLLENSLYAWTYYVKTPANGGSDAADGLSWATAWATVTKVNATVVPGDSVRFGTGVWYNSRFDLPVGGTSATDRTAYGCSTFTAASAHLSKIRGGEIVAGTWVPHDTLGAEWIWKIPYSPTNLARNSWSGRTDIVTCVVQDGVLMRPRRVLNSGDSWLYSDNLGAVEGLFFVETYGDQFYNAIADTLYIWPFTRTDPNSSVVMAAASDVVSGRQEGNDYITFYGLDLELGFNIVSMGSSDGGGGDYFRFENCNFTWASNMHAANPAIISHGNTYGASVDSWSRFNFFDACSLRYCRGDSPIVHGGAGFSFYSIRETVVQNCFIDSTVVAAGVGFKMARVDKFGHTAYGNVVKGCTILGKSESGIWLGTSSEACSVYANTIINGDGAGIAFYTGDDAHSTNFEYSIHGNNVIYNNTVVGTDRLWFMDYSFDAGGNKIRYNIFYDHDPGSYGTRWAGIRQHSYEAFVSVDSNMYYDPITSFSGYLDGSDNWTFSAWQAHGLDVHGVFANPNFDDVVNGNVARTSSTQEMNLSYGGRTWTRYGAWQPTPNQHSPNWHDIDQIWHDTYGGLVNAANGFAAGDTLNLIENIYCRNKKWGLIIQVPVLVLGNGYALHPDSVVLNTIANNSFETPDTDPTRAANWDFSGAANITRQFGHWQVVTEGSDEPSLWHGSYALRVQLPCGTQTVKSSALYQFAPKTHHAIEMAYLNTADNNVRITVGLLNANNDTAYSATNIVGIMERGSEPVFVHFMTKDTVETYRVFIQIIGGAAAASSNQIFIDHVLHTTYRTFGIALEPDTCALTIDMMDNQRFLNPSTGLMETDPGTCYGSTNSNRELWGIGAQGGIGEGTEIRDLRIEPVQPSLYGWGIYGSYTCSDVTIDRGTIKPKGSNPQGVFTWNGIRWSVDSIDVIFPTDPLDYHYTKREAIPSVGINLRADKNSYGYSSRVSYCRIYNYPYQGVYVTTRRDTSADDVLQYPQNIVEGCEFYPKTIITNGFAIEDYGNAASIIRNNKIFGSGQYHGTGIHITTKLADADSLQWSIVDGNVGTVESYPYSQEYSYGLLAYGIQHEGVALCSLRANYVTALAIDPAAPAVDGIRFTRSGSFKLVMHDNTFRGFSTGNVTGAAAHFYAPNWAFDPVTDVFDCFTNDFITNGVALRSVGVNSVGLQFRDCLFDYKDTLTAPNWKKMKSGENAFLPARDLRFIDNRYGDAEADSAFEQTMMFGAYNYLSTADNGTEWLLSWSTTINSLGAGGPQEGDSVFIITAQADTVSKGATNVLGQYIAIIDQFRDSAATTTYNQSVDRTNYSPYTIRVRHSGFELEQVVAIDDKKTLNFNFSNDLSGLFKRKKRIIE